MIKISKTSDGAKLKFGRTEYSYIWNDATIDDFKKMVDDIKDLLGVSAIVIITGDTELDEDRWTD